jgi:hypothetical protein
VLVEAEDELEVLCSKERERRESCCCVPFGFGLSLGLLWLAGCCWRTGCEWLALAIACLLVLTDWLFELFVRTAVVSPPSLVHPNDE